MVLCSFVTLQCYKQICLILTQNDPLMSEMQKKTIHSMELTLRKMYFGYKI